MVNIDKRFTSLTDQDFAALVGTVAGPVHVPGDRGYEAECASFNLSAPQRPAVVVGARTAEDVRAAVRFAADRGMPVAVLATGHGSFAPSDGAVLINTRRMDEVAIDPEARTARVGAGTRTQQVIEAASIAGLAPLIGSAPSVSVVGYTLGGGIGPLGRAYGFAADQVISIVLVTADGAIRRITAESEPDLFWALRGGKGNFGVVTALEYRLLPVTRLYGGALFFPGDRAADALRTWARWVREVPDEMTSAISLLRAPEMPEVPEPLRGKFSAQVQFAYLGSETDGARLIEPLRGMPRIIDTAAELPFSNVASIYVEPSDPVPLLNRSALLDQLSPGAIDTLIELGGPAADCPLVRIEVQHLGGALARPGQHPSAVTNRDADFHVHALGLGGPDQAAAITAYGDELVRRLETWGAGRRNINYLTAGDTGPDGVQRAYDEQTYQRLAAIKRAYDPQNIFRVNFNIPPA